MSKAPAFMFYPSDWMDKKVLRMSYEAQGVYMRILCFMWNDSNDQCSIEDDDKTLARILSLPVLRFKRLKKELLWEGDPIFIIENNRFISKRLRQEKARQEDKSAKAKESANKRWVDSHSERNANAMRRQCISVSSSYKENTLLTESTKESVSVDTNTSISPARSYSDRFTPEGQETRRQAIEVLHYLNERCGKTYHDTYAGIRHIIDRLSENFSVADLKAIIDTKLCDPHFQTHRNLLSPDTLFRSDNAEKYRYEKPEDYDCKPDTPITTKPSEEAREKENKKIEDMNAQRERLKKKYPDLQKQFKQAVIDPLGEELNKHSWTAFIEPLVVVSLENETLTLFEKENSFVAEHYTSEIESKLQSAGLAKKVAFTTTVKNGSGRDEITK